MLQCIRILILSVLCIQLIGCCIPVKKAPWMQSTAEVVSVRKQGDEFVYVLHYPQEHSVFKKIIVVEATMNKPPKLGQKVRLKYLKKHPKQYHLLDQLQTVKPAPRYHATLGLQFQNFIDTTRVHNKKARPIQTVIWYPGQHSEKLSQLEQDPWKLEPVHVNAKMRHVRKKHPLILLSHGFSGTAYANAWIAEGLAKKGYIVAAISHYGNSKGSMIPELSFRPWNRPQDMSFALYQLLTHSPIKDNIDITKIGVAGFSQGGITALWLAGLEGQLNPENLKKQFNLNPTTPPPLSKKYIPFPDHSLDDLEKMLNNFSAQDYQKANQSYKENFIKAAVAIAPGLEKENHMFGPDGISRIQIPTMIIDGGSDQILNTKEWGQYFKDYMPKNEYHVIKGKVSHFTFLNEGNDAGKKLDPELTLDDDSVNRHKVHKKLITMIDEFFQKNL